MALNNRYSLLDEEDEDLLPGEENADPNIDNLDLAALPDEEEQPEQQTEEPAPSGSPLDDEQPEGEEGEPQPEDNTAEADASPLIDEAPPSLTSPVGGLPSIAAGPSSVPSPSSAIPPNAQDRLNQVLARAPQVFQRKPPKWYQKLGAVATGAAAGVYNANPYERPVNPGDAIQGILYPGQARKEAQYGVELNTAKQAADLERQKTKDQTQQTEIQARANAENKRGDYYEGLNTQRSDVASDRLAAMKSERNRKFLADQLKGREADATYQAATAPRPAGYQFIEDPEKQGYGFAVPPAWTPAPKELLPFLPGTQEGEMISFGEKKAAADAYIKKTLQTEKTSNPTNIMLGIRATGKATGNPLVDQMSPKEAGAALDRSKENPNQLAAQNALTPGGLDALATAIHYGGSVPTGFSRNPNMVAKIVNRYAEMFPGENIAANKALYDAAKGSLAGLQKQRDSVVAFENTAGKNLDLFMQTAKPIIDSGSPWINSPLRSISKSGLGDADVAAYDAARQVALTEIAKVTNNPGLNGQLSDSARREVTSLVPENASLAQLYRVAGILKQDMQNRQSGLDQQLGVMHNNLMGNQPATPVNNNTPPPAGNPVAVTDPRGVVHSFPTQAQADAFKKAAKIQ